MKYLKMHYCRAYRYEKIKVYLHQSKLKQSTREKNSYFGLQICSNLIVVCGKIQSNNSLSVRKFRSVKTLLALFNFDQIFLKLPLYAAMQLIITIIATIRGSSIIIAFFWALELLLPIVKYTIKEVNAHLPISCEFPRSSI